MKTWFWDLILGLTAIFVTALALFTYLNLTKPQKTALMPRGPQIEANIIDYSPWQPDVQNKATTTLSTPKNQLVNCYRFQDKTQICK